MSWLAEKIDAFLAAAVVALMGVIGSQGQAFTVQYVQRLGGHLDEARIHLSDVQGGLRYRVMGDTVRAELETDAKTRVATLQRAYDAVKGANIFIRPLAILRYGDVDVIAGTKRDFVPALPMNADAIIYTLVGMIGGFVIYEVVRLPVLLILREPRRRKFRKRG